MKAASQSERRGPLPEEIVFLDLARTTERLSEPMVQLLKSEDLSPSQYNVLRILRGSPEGLTCTEVAARLITRDPDITRLMDRLEKRALVARARDNRDRRVVVTRITGDGLALLTRLDQPVRDLHRKLLGHLGPDRLRALRELLEVCRSGLA